MASLKMVFQLEEPNLQPKVFLDRPGKKSPPKKNLGRA
jgi:hypothetical protein